MLTGTCAVAGGTFSGTVPLGGTPGFAHTFNDVSGTSLYHIDRTTYAAGFRLKPTALADKATIDRKVREAHLAAEIAEKYSKDEILEAYLNMAYFGHGAYGAEAEKIKRKYGCAMASMVRPEENIEVKVSNFYAKVANPVLADLKLDIPGLKIADVYPKDLPDLFRGSQLMVLGRYQGLRLSELTRFRAAAQEGA